MAKLKAILIGKPEFIFRFRDSIKIVLLKGFIPSDRSETGEVTVNPVKAAMKICISCFVPAFKAQFFKLFLCGIVKDGFNVFRSIHNLNLYTRFLSLSSSISEASWT